MKIHELFETTEKFKWYLTGEARYIPAEYGAESYFSVEVRNEDDEDCAVSAMVFRNPNSPIECDIEGGDKIKSLTSKDRNEISRLVLNNKQISDIIKKYQADWKSQKDSFNDDGLYVPQDLTGM